MTLHEIEMLTNFYQLQLKCWLWYRLNFIKQTDNLSYKWGIFNTMIVSKSLFYTLLIFTHSYPISFPFLYLFFWKFSTKILIHWNEQEMCKNFWRKYLYRNRSLKPREVCHHVFLIKTKTKKSIDWVGAGDQYEKKVRFKILVCKNILYL